MTPDDGELIQQISRMDSKAFDDLYDKYKSSVYRFAIFLTQNREEADDLFQETWLRVVQYLPRTANVRDFKAWTFTITANLHRDALRKKRIRRLFFSRKSIDTDLKDGISDHSLSSEKSPITNESDRVDIGIAISRAVADLSPRQRRVFVLKEIEGFKHSEVSEILHLPVGTIKSLMHRAVKRLQRDLSDYGPGVKCSS